MPLRNVGIVVGNTFLNALVCSWVIWVNGEQIFLSFFLTTKVQTATLQSILYFTVYICCGVLDTEWFSSEDGYRFFLRRIHSLFYRLFLGWSACCIEVPNFGVHKSQMVHNECVLGATIKQRAFKNSHFNVK